MVLQTMQRAGFIGHNQAAIFKDLKLLDVGFGRFVAAHTHPLKTSNPPI
jgi:hypothetical protein